MKTGKKKYIHTSAPRGQTGLGFAGETLKEDIAANVYMTDFMREEVSEFSSLNYYERCLCVNSWHSFEPCTCCIKQPYIHKDYFKAYHLCPGANDVPVKISRWKALEILNDWNLDQSKEALKGKRSMRWVYFLTEEKL